MINKGLNFSNIPELTKTPQRANIQKWHLIEKIIVRK